MPSKILSCLSSAFFFRKKIREAESREEMAEIALHVVAESERLRQWCRDQGLVPPKWFITPDERAARVKHLAEVVPFETSDDEPPKAS